STSFESRRIFCELSIGVEWISFVSCETIFTSSYRVSMAGLKISTLRLAIFTRFSLLISSSVFPLNIDPQTTSIHPLRSPRIFGSINIVKIYSQQKDNNFIGKQFVTWGSEFS